MSDTKLTGKQKAAAIIISLGADDASKIYKYLKEEEIEQLTFEISRLQHLSPQVMESTLKDFYDLCLTQKVITEGGFEYARNVLEKAFGAQTASSLLERVTKTMRTKSFEFFRKADYKNLITII
ncbi:Flagellar motor switch protein FliG [bioreactor metagenome]|uniref:Flagellar motor switch protein FliG n=1 Tax=bioreactor metagenome TaxID=1076179 RepID=A0A644XF65_9ZZZZ